MKSFTDDAFFREKVVSDHAKSDSRKWCWESYGYKENHSQKQISRHKFIERSFHDEHQPFFRRENPRSFRYVRT